MSPLINDGFFISNKAEFEKEWAAINTMIDTSSSFEEMFVQENYGFFCFNEQDVVLAIDYWTILRRLALLSGDQKLYLVEVQKSYQERLSSEGKQYFWKKICVSDSSEDFRKILLPDDMDYCVPAVSNYILIYPESKTWFIYCDRDFEIAMFSLRLDEDFQPYREILQEDWSSIHRLMDFYFTVVSRSRADKTEIEKIIRLYPSPLSETL
jgi:hypothetical protein